MSGPKRKREVQLNFRVSPEELALIEQKMAQLGTKNREAYLRKMALDGYVAVSYTHLDVYKRQARCREVHSRHLPGGRAAGAGRGRGHRRIPPG